MRIRGQYSRFAAFFSLLLLSAVSFAQNSSLDSLQTQLTRLEKLRVANIDLMDKQALRQQAQVGQKIDNSMIKKGKLSLMHAQAQLLSAKTRVNDYKEAYAKTQAQIKRLQGQFQKIQVSQLDANQLERQSRDLQKALNEKNQALVIIGQQLSIAETLSKQASQLQQLAQNHNGSLRSQLAQQLTASRRDKMRQAEKKARLEQAGMLKKLDEITEKLADSEDEGLQISLQSQQFYYETNVKLIDLDLSFQALNDNLVSVLIGNITASDNRVLSRRIPQLKAAVQEAQSLTSKLNTVSNLIKRQQAVITQALQTRLFNQAQVQASTERLNQLTKTLSTQRTRLNELQKRLVLNQKAIGERLNQSKSAAHMSMPSYDVVTQLLTLPNTALKFLSSLQTQLAQALTQFSLTSWLGLSLWLSTLVMSLLLLKRYLAVVIAKVSHTRARVSSNALYIAGQLLRRNLLGLGLFMGLWGVNLIAALPFKFYAPLFYLGLVWFTFKGIIGIAKLSLLERMSDATGRDVRLYHRLKWTFITGGIITSLTVLVHQLYLSPDLQDVMTRLFMGFLLTVSLVLLKGRDVMPSLLAPYLDKKRVYLERATKLMSILMPLMLMSNAIIGLLGYMHLAWQMSYYQVAIVMVIVAYVVVRGVFLDCLELLSGLAIRYLNNGWLWSEAFLKPLDRFVRLLALVGAVVAGGSLLGLTLDSWQVVLLSKVLTYHIFTFSGGEITLLSTIEFGMLALAVGWAGRWSREFAYRWLFRHIQDVAARKSLSAFCQYTVICIGALITLRVLGIDLTGMAMILGGLAVGLGFGMRDFANNIISGLMLMIERPVREGDLVAIGDFEGQVTHIGLRAMQLRSWDHTELMVPNAEAFNKTFTNWTLKDNIVRTVVSIHVHRDDDPYLVKRHIEAVLTDFPEVQTDPPPKALLCEINDALIQFHVQYFIDVQAHSRLQVRSKVLLAIYSKLKTLGIRHPYPQHQLHVHNASADALTLSN